MAHTEASLLQFLVDIDFAKRYYAYYEACKSREDSEGLDPAAIAVVLEPYGFKYHKRDRFYRYFEQQGKREVELHVAFSDGSIELILGMKADGATLGGTFAGLAEDVESLKDPDFSYDPPYPEIPYTNREELKEAVEFALGIFTEVKERLFSETSER